ncbi:hypothetical protein MNBD_GAMMA22-1624 [hydrothermal vent metagenome]|uniref:Thioredoxin-like fold domain-containing protein n=1 Tax=hydrothermal vent metagenome TaxID=652676 RepID=A0A3B1A3N5_9ZZZZ
MQKNYTIIYTALLEFIGFVAFFSIIAFSFIPDSQAAAEIYSDYENQSETQAGSDDDVGFKETVIMTSNLQADAKIAKQKQVPILLLFTQQSCGFCEVVRSDFLRPMLLNREYDNRVLIRQIEYDGDDVVGFDGKKISMDNFMLPYNVGFTPTVLFLDSSGAELTEQLVGITTVYYYGGFIDDNIALALKKIRAANDAKIAVN